MNKQAMFTDAHKAAKTGKHMFASYGKAFAFYLSQCWINADKYTTSNTDKVSSVCDFLINYTGNAGKYGSYKQQSSKAADLIHQATLCGGFASQVAETVRTANRCSPKQALVIAKALVSNNRVNNFTF